MFSAFCNVSNATPTTFPSLNAGPPLFPAFIAASIWHNKYLIRIQFTKPLLRNRGYSVSALCSQKPVQNLHIRQHRELTGIPYETLETSELKGQSLSVQHQTTIQNCQL